MKALSKKKTATTSLLVCSALVCLPVDVRAQSPSPLGSEIQASLSSDQRAKLSHDTYILGPGDRLYIEVLNLPEFSGSVAIGPDGTIYLPRLRALYVDGLTIEELRLLLTERYKTYIKLPEIYIRPLTYRPVRIYVGGEVKRPGYYTLSGNNELSRLSDSAEAQQLQTGTATALTSTSLNQTPGGQLIRSGASRHTTFGKVFPTIFDAIRTAQGITPYSDLAQVEVTRRQPMSSGGGRLRANLNFLSLITEGDESQNIRLFDGDVVSVGKSPNVLREQLLKAGQTNLTPQFLQVYVSGRVQQPGAVTLPQGSSLVQAIDLAGGTKVLHGKVEFIRFTREGTIDRRIFGFKSDAPSGDYRNPVLMAGDVVRLRETAMTKSLAVINEFATPAISVYSVYSLFDSFSN